MKVRTACGALLFGLCLASGWAQPGAGPPERLIKVVGDATVYVMPDTAQVSFTVRAENKVLAVARAEAATRANAAVSALKALKIPGLALNTDAIQVSPLVKGQEMRAPGYREDVEVAVEVLGYRVTSSISATVKAGEGSFKDQVAKVVDTALQNGATSLRGPYFSKTDEDATELMALEKATKNAVAKAQALARGLGVTVLDYTLVSMTGQDDAGSRYYRGREAPPPPMGMPGGPAAMPTVIEVKEIPVGATVWLQARFTPAPK